MESTPQLKHRQDLLRMTRAEVHSLIEREARENPVLEIFMRDEDVHSTEAQHPGAAPAPDACVEEEDGEHHIYHLVDGPSLRIAHSYSQALARPETGEGEREVIKNHLRSAVDLLRNIEHRRQCIYLVVEYIVRSQPDFLLSGPSHLKPLSLGEAARATRMSDSTVSLTVAGKYLRTRHGVFELRRFFTEG